MKRKWNTMGRKLKIDKVTLRRVKV